MSYADSSKIGTARTIATDRRIRREDRRKRLIRRDAVYANELRAALREARTLVRFDRAAMAS